MNRYFLLGITGSFPLLPSVAKACFEVYSCPGVYGGLRTNLRLYAGPSFIGTFRYCCCRLPIGIALALGRQIVDAAIPMGLRDLYRVIRGVPLSCGCSQRPCC